MYIYFPTEEPWTWEQLGNPLANEWANNNTVMRHHQTWTPIGQTTHTGEPGNNRRLPNDRCEHLPQIPTNRLLHDQAAPPIRQDPNRAPRHELSEAEQLGCLGRQRRIDEFA